MATRIDYQAPILALIVRASLPTASRLHLEFPANQFFSPELDLPEYDSYDTLRQQVYTAMTAGSEYFGFA